VATCATWPFDARAFCAWSPRTNVAERPDTMGGVARLAVDASGIYVAFLSWALIQERRASSLHALS